MVELKRRTSSEVDTETSYDNIIDVSDRKSYKEHERETAEIYSPRESFVAPKIVPTHQTRTQRADRPVIKKESRHVSEDKETLSSKTKVLLAAYIIIAIVLAAVVIGTGVAITQAGTRSSLLENQLSNLSLQIETQEEQLLLANDPAHIAGTAMLEYDMEVVGENVTKIPLIETVDVKEYTATTNGFDKFCDWVSRIFG